MLAQLKSIAFIGQRNFASDTRRSTVKRSGRQMPPLYAMVLLLGGTFLAVMQPVILARPRMQGAVVSIGILPFKDESGTNAPPALAQRLAQQLQRKLNTNLKGFVARPLSSGASSDIQTMSVEDVSALGKRNGVRFVIRGGLLGAEMTETGLTVQVFAEVVSVDSGNVTTLRAEGTGEGLAGEIEWDSINVSGADFHASTIGKVFGTALEQLSVAIRTALEPASTPTAPEQSAAAEPTEPDESAGTSESDADLQQLIAQAESLLTGGSSGSNANLATLSEALEGLKTTLSSKVSVLEQGGDTSAIDAKVVEKKAQLQTAVNSITEQQVSNAENGNSASGEGVNEGEGESSGERTSMLTKINTSLGETFNILQKIQEIRSLFRRSQEESDSSQSATSEESTDTPVETEAPLEEVEGAITESGTPVEGLTVTEPESGASDTTGQDGTYSLKVPGGELVTLLVSKGGKQLAEGQLDVAKGKAANADFELKSASAAGAARMRLIPPVVAIKSLKTNATAKGLVKGIVRDAQGRPVPRALVNLKGLGVARTDSQGRYTFTGVPAGMHQLAIRRSGLRLKSEQVRVAANKAIEAKTQFGASDRMAKSPTVTPIVRGSGIELEGIVTDGDRNPLAGAKVRIINGGESATVVTATKGAYKFRNVKPGTYRLLASKLGYATRAQSIMLRAGVSEKRVFQLARQTSPLVTRVLEKKRTVPVADKSAQAPSRKPRLIDSVVITPRTMPSPNITFGQIKGFVFDARSKRPVAGARVAIRGRQAATGSDGRYSFERLAPGQYRVDVRKPGFADGLGTVTIRAGQVATLNVQILQASGIRSR